MSGAIFLFLASVALVSSSETVNSRNNITMGIIGPNDGLLNRRTIQKQPIVNTTQWELVTWQGVARDVITAVRVTQVGQQSSSATPQGGGIGTNWLHVRLQSSYGGGYNYRIEIFGQGPSASSAGAHGSTMFICLLMLIAVALAQLLH